MLTCNKTFGASYGSQKPLGFVCVNRMLDILLVRDNFQVIQPIIGAVKVFVIYFQTALNTPVKCLPQNAMDSAASVHAVSTQQDLKVPFQQFNFARPVRSVTRPSLTQLDRMCRGYAGAQKLSNLFKGGTVLKHLLGFGNFGGSKGFTSGNPAHVSKIAYLVQIFKVQNWFPCFHSLTPFNMNRSIA